MEYEEINPNRAIEFIIKESGKFASAKANRIYLENFLRSKKSLLMSKSSAKSVAAAEVDAYADPEYIKVLMGLREAVEEEERLKWQLIAAQARIEVWRSTEATNRAIDKNVG